jgi:hypothetical protein
MEEKPIVATKIAYKLINDDVFETDIHIYEYNPTSYAIHSSEHFGKAFKEQLKEVGGIYKPNLTKFPYKGWVISRGKYETLRSLINKIFNEEVKGEVPVEYKKKTFSAITEGPMGPVPQLPPMVSDFKRFFDKMNNVKEDKNIFMDGTNTYVWGSIEVVDNLIKELKLNPMMTFTSLSHKFVYSR